MDDAKEFCLKWNSFMDVFQGTFAKLLNKEHFVDVSLACDGETIKCHKVVLSACSNYFQSLLLENQHPHPLIILRDVPAKDMQALIRFMYTGEVTVAQTQLNSLIRVADLLKIKGLADTESKSEKKEPQVETPQPPTPPVKGENAFSSQYSDTRTPPLKRKRTKPPPPPLVERTAVPASVPLSLTLPHEVPQGSPGLPDPESQSQQSHNSSEPALSPRDNAVTPNMEEGNQSFKDLKPKQDISGVEDEGEENSNQFDDGGDEFDFKTDGSVIGNGEEAGSSGSLNSSGLGFFPIEELFTDASEMEVENAKILQLMQSPDFRRMPKHLQDAVFAVVRGMSFNEASRIYKTSSVRLVAKRFGVESSTKRHSFFQGKQYTTESIEQALEAVKSGQQSLCSASRTFNIPFATLQVVAKKRGIKSQFRKVENKTEKPVMETEILYQFGAISQ